MWRAQGLRFTVAVLPILASTAIVVALTAACSRRAARGPMVAVPSPSLTPATAPELQAGSTEPRRKTLASGALPQAALALARIAKRTGAAYSGNILLCRELSRRTLGRILPGTPEVPWPRNRFTLTTVDTGWSIVSYSNSTYATVYLENDENSASDGTVMETYGGNFGGLCTMDVSGNLYCSGSKSAVVPVDGGSKKVALYAVEAPENWFEDAGSGQLANGSAVIHLENMFPANPSTRVLTIMFS